MDYKGPLVTSPPSFSFLQKKKKRKKPLKNPNLLRLLIASPSLFSSLLFRLQSLTPGETEESYICLTSASFTVCLCELVSCLFFFLLISLSSSIILFSVESFLFSLWIY